LAATLSLQRHCAPFKSSHHRNGSRFRGKLQLALYMLYCHDRRHGRYENRGDRKYQADHRQTSPIDTHIVSLWRESVADLYARALRWIKFLKLPGPVLSGAVIGRGSQVFAVRHVLPYYGRVRTVERAVPSLFRVLHLIQDKSGDPGPDCKQHWEIQRDHNIPGGKWTDCSQCKTGQCVHEAETQKLCGLFLDAAAVKDARGDADAWVSGHSSPKQLQEYLQEIEQEFMADSAIDKVIAAQAKYGTHGD
jgi:hypothetical protein